MKCGENYFMIRAEKNIVIIITVSMLIRLPYIVYILNHKNARPDTKSYDLFSVEGSKNMLMYNQESFDKIIQYFMNKKIRIFFDVSQKGEVTLIESDPQSLEDHEEHLSIVQNFVNDQRISGILPTNRGGEMEFGYHIE